MRNKIIVIMLSTIFSISVFSCSKEDNTSIETPEETESAAVESEDNTTDEEASETDLSNLSDDKKREILGQYVGVIDKLEDTTFTMYVNTDKNGQFQEKIECDSGTLCYMLPDSVPNRNS